MSLTRLLSLAGLIMPLALCAQTIVGIGSSTISGEGASIPDSAWLNLLAAYYTQQGLSVSIENLGWSGSTTFNGMPSNYKQPSAVRNDSTPFFQHNITYAWTFNPDIVLIAYPSNDVVVGYTVTQWLANLRTIYDSVVAQGKPAWVATSQPRNDQPMSILLQLKEARDSILQEFSGHVLNFYDPLVDPVTLGIQAGLTNDAIHPNDAGHQLLFQTAKAANILGGGAPLPLTITSFNAIWNNGAIDLHWQLAGTEQPLVSTVERSDDGLTFTDLWQEPVADQGHSDHSYTDQHPLAGRNFYRIKLDDHVVQRYSAIVSVSDPGVGWSLEKLYSTGDGAQWNLVLNSASGGKVSILVVDGGGKTILRYQTTFQAPKGEFTFDLSPFAAGLYFVEIIPENNSVITKAIRRM